MYASSSYRYSDFNVFINAVISQPFTANNYQCVLTNTYICLLSLVVHTHFDLYSLLVISSETTRIYWSVRLSLWCQDYQNPQPQDCWRQWNLVCISYRSADTTYRKWTFEVRPPAQRGAAPNLNWWEEMTYYEWGAYIPYHYNSYRNCSDRLYVMFGCFIGS